MRNDQEKDTLTTYKIWKESGVTSGRIGTHDERLANYSQRDAEISMRLLHAFNQIDIEAAAKRRRAILLVILGVVSVCVLAYVIWRYA